MLEDYQVSSAIMKTTVEYVTVPENKENYLVLTLEADFAESFCITAVLPQDLEGLFKKFIEDFRITFIYINFNINISENFAMDETTGEIFIIKKLDADNINLGNNVTLKAAALLRRETCEQSQISSQLLRYIELSKRLISIED